MGNSNTLPAAGKSKMTIDDFSSFEKWNRSLNKFRSVNTMTSVVFNLPDFSFHENVKLTTRVDYYSNNYGRKTQGSFMTLAILFIFMDWLISFIYNPFLEVTVLEVVLNLVIIVFAALTGKLAGLLYSHFSLIKIAHRIRRRLAGVYEVKHA